MLLSCLVQTDLSAQDAERGVWPSADWAAWGNRDKWENGEISQGPGAVAEFSGSTEQAHAGFVITLGATDVVLGSLIRSGDRGFVMFNKSVEEPGSITFVGEDPLIDAGQTGVRIYARVMGFDGLAKTGAAWLRLENPANSLEGGITVRQGILTGALPGSLGNNVILLEGDYSGLALVEGRFDNSVIIDCARPQLQATSLDGSDGHQSELAGNIEQRGGGGDLAVSATGTRGRLTLSGDNSFGGSVVVGRVDNRGAIVLRASSSTALGSAGGSVFFAADGTKTHDEDALELSGGITVEGKTLTLRGRGAEAAGSLRSTDGDNTWAGDIDLGSLPAATIGVDGGTLVVSGAVSGQDPAVALVKTGTGTLELRGEASHAGGTVIKGGTLVAANPRALAGRSVTVEAGEQAAALAIQGGQTVRTETLTLQGGGAALHFSPVPSNEPMLAVAGKLQGAGTVNIEGDALAPGNYTLLVVGGGREGELTLGRMPAGSAGQLRWQGNNVVLEVKAS